MTDDAPVMIPMPRYLSYVRLSDLRPALRNPKKHLLPDICASMDRHGFVNPVIRCDRTLRLAAGHGRTAALVLKKSQGDPMPDGLVIDEDGEWCVPVLNGWSSRNDAELEAYIIADNKITENGGWDSPMLATMIHDLIQFDPGLIESVGMTADDVDDLLRTVDPERFDTDPDALPSGGGDLDTDSDTENVGSNPRPASIMCPDCGHEFIPAAKES